MFFFIRGFSLLSIFEPFKIKAEFLQKHKIINTPKKHTLFRLLTMPSPNNSVDVVTGPKVGYHCNKWLWVQCPQLCKTQSKRQKSEDMNHLFLFPVFVWGKREGSPPKELRATAPVLVGSAFHFPPKLMLNLTIKCGGNYFDCKIQYEILCLMQIA